MLPPFVTQNINIITKYFKTTTKWKTSLTIYPNFPGKSCPKEEAKWREQKHAWRPGEVESTKTLWPFWQYLASHLRCMCNKITWGKEHEFIHSSSSLLRSNYYFFILILEIKLSSFWFPSIKQHLNCDCFLSTDNDDIKTGQDYHC